MNPSISAATARVLRWEMPGVCALAWLAFISIPLAHQALGLSWDALHHHFYLGWISESPRFDLDFQAASTQSYQFPYLYWPVYRMAMWGWTGAAAGVALATLHATAVPAVWLIARTLLPGASVFDVGMRALAVLMAFASSVVLSQFGSTSNDLLASIPLVWALAFGLLPLDAARSLRMTPLRCAMFSGLAAGLAVACKLSNGPLVVAAMPLVWLLAAPGGWLPRLRHAFVAGVFTLLGFGLSYGWWGTQLWQRFGNPVYPFAHAQFKPLRDAAGWRAP